jgi:hypothetical protein
MHLYAVDGTRLKSGYPSRHRHRHCRAIHYDHSIAGVIVKAVVMNRLQLCLFCEASGGNSYNEHGKGATEGS